MRAQIALLVIVCWVGVGVATAPTVQAGWTGESASGFFDSVGSALPDALASPARLARARAGRLRASPSVALAGALTRAARRETLHGHGAFRIASASLGAAIGRCSMLGSAKFGAAVLALVTLLAGCPAQARDMMLTIYDDGRSCPHDCDAHVVFNPADNGTRFAFSPQSARTSPAPCVAGSDCTICFGEADDTCMTAVYRGGGPAKGRFDFTPAFYDANCSRGDIPEALRKQCRSLDRAAARLGYAEAVNCFATPDNPKCADVMRAAKAAQDADAPKRAQCLSMGETAYNKAQSDPAEKRSNGCDYSLLALGGHGKWKKLLPAACRPNTSVDPFGLDCCSASVRFAAANHPECRSFFPR